MLEWMRGYRSEWLRLDVMAGLVTAAVVIPKAMAYATIAGLPVEAGLYTAFLPLLIYAILGSSRPLSVSTTTTLAILAGAQLGEIAQGGRPRCGRSGPATLTLLTGVILVAASVLRLGFVANFISEPVLVGFKAGIGMVIVFDQVPKLLGIHIHKSGFFRNILAIFDALPKTSTGDARWSALAMIAVLVGLASFRAEGAGPARGGRRRNRGHRLSRAPGARRRDRRAHPDRPAVADPARPLSRRAALARGARHRADELHRDDRRGARLREERRTDAAGEPGAVRHRPRQCRQAPSSAPCRREAAPPRPR